MALVESQLEARNRAGTGIELRGEAPALGVALVLMLMFMGATLPTPLYVIYRDELNFSQITLTLIYASSPASSPNTLRRRSSCRSLFYSRWELPPPPSPGSCQRR